MSGASNFVEGVDLSFAVIFGISLFFLVGITVVMVYFVIRYRRSKHPKAAQIDGNHKLEIIWTIVPTILVLIMFWYGWLGFKPMREIPEDAIPIKAYAQMWTWSFEYENGKRSAELVVPLNKAVKLDLISHDVLHSLYIPAFRIKEDVVPGGNNKMWFIAQKEGNYDIFCAEYCGDRHSYMISQVEVIPDNEFKQWLLKEDAPEGEHPGLTVLKQNACLSCHSLDGTRLVGPSFKGIYGLTEIVVTDGKEREVTVDDEYIIRSLNDPNADVVKTYNPGLMISYTKQINKEDMEHIIEYLKTLQ
jgi:cytochrome c oxidase subunit 2